MNDDSPHTGETPAEQAAREGAETYLLLSEISEQLPPGSQRQATLALRDTITATIARTISQEHRLAEAEASRELIDALLGADNMPWLVTVLRQRLSPAQIAEIHELTRPQ